MRSATPKVLHPVCGKPMVEWVIDAAREAGAGAGRLRHAARRRRGRGAARGRRGRRAAARGRAPARPCSPPATRSPTGPCVVLSGDHPLVDRRADRGACSRAHAASGAAATCSPPRSSTRPATGASSATGERRGRADRRDQVHRRACPPTSSRSARSTSAPTSFEAAATSSRRSTRSGSTNGERLPHRRLPGPERRRGKRCRTHKTTDAGSALGVNDRAGLMEAERARPAAHPRARTRARA